MIVGIDFGASYIKSVCVNNGVINSRIIKSNSKDLSILDYIDDIIKDCKCKPSQVFITGGMTKNAKLEKMDDVIIVDEMEAFSKGALHLSNLTSGIIVSFGTGVCITKYECGVQHIAGTGVGGGTLTGLCNALVGVADFNELEEMGTKGKASGVNLTVGDIVGGSIGNLTSDMTASNLAKLDAGERNDKVAGIFRLVGEVVGVTAGLVCRERQSKSAIFVGFMSQSPLMKKIIKEVLSSFSVKAIFPKDGEYAGALGATL